MGHPIFISRSSSVHKTFIICSSSLHHAFIIYSSRIHHLFIARSLSLWLPFIMSSLKLFCQPLSNDNSESIRDLFCPSNHPAPCLMNKSENVATSEWHLMRSDKLPSVPVMSLRGCFRTFLIFFCQLESSENRNSQVFQKITWCDLTGVENGTSQTMFIQSKAAPKWIELQKQAYAIVSSDGIFCVLGSQKTRTFA